jgi:hypothetical protein
MQINSQAPPEAANCRLNATFLAVNVWTLRENHLASRTPTGANAPFLDSAAPSYRTNRLLRNIVGLIAHETPLCLRYVGVYGTKLTVLTPSLALRAFVRARRLFQNSS